MKQFVSGSEKDKVDFLLDFALLNVSQLDFGLLNVNLSLCGGHIFFHLISFVKSKISSMTKLEETIIQRKKRKKEKLEERKSGKASEDIGFLAPVAPDTQTHTSQSFSSKRNPTVLEICPMLP